MELTPEQKELEVINALDCGRFSAKTKAGLNDLAAVWDSLQGFNHLALPNILFKFRSKLPRTSGVYILYKDSDVYYIGQAVDIAVRWKGHNVLDKLALASEVIVEDDMRIGWIEVPKALLDFVEIYLIGLLRPVLNITHNTPL